MTPQAPPKPPRQVRTSHEPPTTETDKQLERIAASTHWTAWFALAAAAGIWVIAIFLLSIITVLVAL